MQNLRVPSVEREICSLSSWRFEARTSKKADHTQISFALHAGTRIAPPSCH
jgi:hypothetical protein